LTVGSKTEPSFEGNRSLFDEHAEPVGGAQPARLRRAYQRRLAAAIDEVEHCGIGPQQLDSDRQIVVAKTDRCCIHDKIGMSYQLVGIRKLREGRKARTQGGGAIESSIVDERPAAFPPLDGGENRGSRTSGADDAYR
jgi:hypothetical protein